MTIIYLFIYFIYLFTYLFLFILFISSPERKAQSELLVSNGDAPASLVRRHASIIVFFSETTKQIYFKIGL
jgi:hypothetical protein